MIALFGGTFDPIHHGHLRVAYEASLALGCTVRLMPANVPPHRTQPRASAEHRVAMIERALAATRSVDDARARPTDDDARALAVDDARALSAAADALHLVLDDRELRRSGPSYTVDTLRELRAELGDDEAIVLLLGADAFAGLPTWHEWEALFDLAHIVMVTRGGDRSAVPDALAAEVVGRLGDVERLRGCAHGRVAELPVTPLEISATRIRESLARGVAPRFLVPDAVLDYIRANGLYAAAAPNA